MIAYFNSNVKTKFSWLGMLVRSAIAAINLNANLNRKPKMTADGRRRYKMKVVIKEIID